MDLNRVLVIIMLLGCIQSSAQDTYEDHVEYLASDKLEGRLPGTRGEKLAWKYIDKQWKKDGLKSIELQKFEFPLPVEYGSKNYIKVDKTKYTINDKSYPLPFSASVEMQVHLTDENARPTDFYMPAAVCIDYSTLSNQNDLNAWRSAYNQYISKGFSGLILYNVSRDLSLDALPSATKIDPLEGFVWVFEGEMPFDKDKIVNVKTELEREKDEARNIYSFIDNGASKTLVLGAHYDHLGYGEYGNSLYRGEPAIHNGADDNASGTAMILEISEELQKEKYQELNYLLIAFSAEELGLIGSNYFVDNLPISKEDILAMINFDMVGRLKEDRNLGIYGTGTAEEWDYLIENINENYSFNINKSESGIGASDHTSFYLEDIPVLHIFTGVHEDYHKPSDDIEKLNFDGMKEIGNYTLDLIASLNRDPNLKFQKTKSDGQRAPKFSVTLGIVPGYFHEGKGLKIDGVSPGKTAERAGLQKDDVIQKMGDYEVGDIYDYMNALGNFKKGDKTTVQILREGKKMNVEVIF